MKKTFSIIVSLIITTLLQAQVPKTVSLAAGGLSSALTITEKSTITNLTITGTINAFDFMTMRDEMPVLAILDFSSATIVDGGTPANEIPTFAFYKSGTSTGKASLTSITLASSVNSIGDYAFKGCSGLVSIVIPASVTSIGGYAFEECSNLSSIIIPSSVTSIREYTFKGCSSLTTINIPSSVATIGYHAFENCNSLTSFNIPSSVSTIGVYAFSGCSGLISVANNSSITSIGDYTFYGCSKLTLISIPASVTSIGVYAFGLCSSLVSITIPPSITTIKSNTFFACRGLISFKFPSSVTKIETDAFSYCSGLTSIYMYSSTPFQLSNVGINYYFGQMNVSACILYVPVGSKKAYGAADTWKEFNIVEFIPTEVKSIDKNEICLYPNPVTEDFRVSGIKEISTFSLFDIEGRLLINRKIENNESISTSSLPKGMYIVRINSEAGILENKLVKN